jgi:hypothetical protein
MSRAAFPVQIAPLINFALILFGRKEKVDYDDSCDKDFISISDIDDC